MASSPFLFLSVTSMASICQQLVDSLPRVQCRLSSDLQCPQPSMDETGLCFSILFSYRQCGVGVGELSFRKQFVSRWRTVTRSRRHIVSPWQEEMILGVRDDCGLLAVICGLLSPN